MDVPLARGRVVRRICSFVLKRGRPPSGVRIQWAFTVDIPLSYSLICFEYACYITVDMVYARRGR